MNIDLQCMRKYIDFRCVATCEITCILIFKIYFLRGENMSDFSYILGYLFLGAMLVLVFLSDKLKHRKERKSRANN